MRTNMKAILLFICTFLAAGYAFALDRAKLEEKAKIVSGWASDPAFIALVKEASANRTAAVVGMDQAQWEKLSIIDPKIREIQTNKVSAWLKSKKEPWTAEAFVNLADGTKAGFLTKPTSWSHKGKAKHDDPMSGKTWEGAVEFDQSTGKEAVQISAPILDGSTPIGSLVVGIETSKL